MVGEDGELSATAKISEEYVMMNPDGSFDYEIVDIGNGKGRNVLKYDLKKIEKKVTPFINAEVAGLMDSEQEAVAAWNVYISKAQVLKKTLRWLKTLTLEHQAGATKKIYHYNKTKKFYLNQNTKNTL